MVGRRAGPEGWGGPTGSPVRADLVGVRPCPVTFPVIRWITGPVLALEVSMSALIIVLGVLGLVAIAFASSARVIRQFERGVVCRLGRVQEPPRAPGLTMIVPIVDHLRKVSVQIVTMPVPAQEGITRDNVTVRVDAVVYFRVHDPVRAMVEVQDSSSRCRRSPRPRCG